LKVTKEILFWKKNQSLLLSKPIGIKFYCYTQINDILVSSKNYFLIVHVGIILFKINFCKFFLPHLKEKVKDSRGKGETLGLNRSM